MNGADNEKAEGATEGTLKIPFSLVGVFLALSFIIILTGYTYYESYRETLTNNVKRQLVSICDLKVRQIAQWRNERLGDAKNIYDNALLTDRLSEFLKDPAHHAVRKLIRSWLAQTRDAYDHKEVAVFDANGKVVLSTEEDIRQEESHTRSAKTSLEAREIIFGDFHKNGTTGQIDIGVFIPVRVSKGAGKHAAGGIMLLTDPRRFLYPLIQSWPVPSETAETLLIRQDGSDVLYLNELRHRKNTALSFRIPVAVASLPAAMAVSGREGPVEGMDYRNIPVIAALGKVPDTPWFLVAKIDSKEAYLPVDQIVLTIVTLVSVGILTAALGIGLFWRNQTTVYYQRLYKAEEARRVSEERFRLSVERAPLPLGLFDGQGTIRYVNDRFVEVFGYTIGEIPTEKEWWRSACPDDAYRRTMVKTWGEAVARATRTGGHIEPVESRVTCKNGSVRVMVISGVVFPDSSLLVTFIDITELKQVEEELRKLSFIDELTGLNNRRGFTILAKQHIKIAERLKRHAALIYADMDNMKWINDTLGHKEGDRALLEFADILRSNVRASDIVARWGGDEFVALILEPADGEGEILCSRLQEALHAYNSEDTRPFKLSISFGLTHYDPENPCTLEELLENGDRLMYEHKRGKLQPE